MSTAGGAAEGAFTVNSLSDLQHASAVEGQVRWDGPRSVWNMSMLGGAIILAPLTFSWGAPLVFLVTAGVTLCAGHSVGFHRRLIHRSFEAPKWVDRTLMWLGTAVGIGGPIWTIRLHDSRDWAQRQPDCHWFLRHGKPWLIDGFYYLNFKLELDRPPQFRPGPVADDPFYRFLDRTWMLQQLPIAALLFAGGGLPWVVWGLFVRVSACTTMHWCISYFAHTREPDDWAVDGAVIQASNVAIMAIPTMGESWHGNHHAFPSSARHGLYPGQVDIGFRFIQLLELLGLAWNVRVPANLPPRAGLTPLTARALSAVSADQARVSSDVRA